MLRPALGAPQGEPEGAAFTELRVHADATAVQLHQALREGEAQARPFVPAARARVDLYELLKQLVLVGRGDPDTGVAHGDPYAPRILEARTGRRERHRYRDRPGRPAQAVSGVRTGRREREPPVRRDGPGPRPLEAPGGAARR